MTKKVFNLVGRKMSGNSKPEDIKMEGSSSQSVSTDTVAITGNEGDPGRWRDLTAYWILGLCNNYGYVVMLTAAHDILKELESDHSSDNSHSDNPRKCNLISTGAILLADIIPSLLIKLVGPFIPFYVKTRVFLACVAAAIGFVLVAFAKAEWMALMGVAFTSLSAGLGELTFLAYTAYFHKNVISTWSSGTGGAGIIGAISYTVLRGVGLNNTETLLVMLLVPILEGLAFFFMLRKPLPMAEQIANIRKKNEEDQMESNVEALHTFKEKILFIKHLLVYMIPLTLVYLFEYFINQGLFELVYFPGIFLDISEQYRWYQVTYQIGVFISRSSVNIIHIKHIWLMAVLQFVNVVFFMFESIYAFVPSIWIVFVIILFEGLLGGGAYVNTFYRMSKEVPLVRRQFALSVVTMSDSGGITLSGFLSMPVHNWICQLPAPARLL